MGLSSSRPTLAELAPILIDEQVGIVRIAGVAGRQAGSPMFHHYWARAADTNAFVGQSNFANGGGAADEPDRALAKAVGEAVERYCAAIYHVEELPLRAANAAEFAVVAPIDFALNDSSQYAEPGFRFVPFNRDTPVRWAPAIDVLTGEELYVPAAMVYVPYYYTPGSGDSPIAQPISTGLACHTSFAAAAAGALNEVIERDAFTIVWQSRAAPPQLEAETLPSPLRNLVDRFVRVGYDITLFDITLDSGVPTILSVSRHDSPEVPAVVVAASTSLDPFVAVRGSLEELAHTGHYCQEITLNIPRLPAGAGGDDIVDQQSHLNYWCDQANARQMDFLFASTVRRSYTELADRHSGDMPFDLALLSNQIAGTGHRALLCDLTTSDVRELGLTVVRALIPGYHPLVSGHRYRALGGRRLRQVPQALGFLESGSQLNSIPHPYP